MSDDESSFVILGSTPTPSMEQYNGHENSSSITSNMMQSSTQTMKNFSLVNSNSLTNSPSLSATKTDSLKANDSLVNPTVVKDNQMTSSIMRASTTSTNDFAEQFLMGEIPAGSLKVSD